MNIGQFLPMAVFVAFYLFAERKALSKTQPVSKAIALCFCAAALIVWGYYTSDLPRVYPSVWVQSVLDRFVPIGPILE